jgi:hypothetical protein
MSHGTGDIDRCGAEDPAQEFDSYVSGLRHFQHPKGSSVWDIGTAYTFLVSSNGWERL